MKAEPRIKLGQIQDHKTKIESDRSQLQKRIQKFQEEGNKASEAFTRTLDHSKTKILSEIRTLKEVIDQLTDSLEDYKKKSLESDKTALNERLDNLVGEIASGVGELKNELNVLSKEYEDDISTIYSEIPSKFNNGLVEIQANQRDRINQFEENMFSHIEGMKKEILSLVDKEDTWQRGVSSSLISSTHDALVEFQQKIRSLADSKIHELNETFSETNADSSRGIGIAKEGLKAELNSAANRLNHTIENQKANNIELQSTFRGHLDESRSNLRKTVEKIRIQTMEDWSSRRTEQLEKLNAIQDSTLKQYEEDLAVNEQFQDKLLSELEHQMRSELYTRLDSVSLTFTQFQDSFVEKVNDLISRLAAFRDETKENVDVLLTSNLKAIGEIGRQTEEYLPEVFTRVSEEYDISRKKTLTSLTKTVKERYGAINDYVDRFETIIDARIEKLVADLDNYLVELNKVTGQYSTDTINKNSLALDQFKKEMMESFNSIEAGQNKNFQKSVQGLQNILQLKQEELINEISSLVSMTEEYTETQSSVIDEKRDEISRRSDVKLTDLKKEIKTLENDEKNLIRDIIERYHQELDENVKAISENVKVLVDNLGDEPKSRVFEFRSRASQDFNHRQKMIDDYMNTLNERFIKFFDDQLYTLDHFISDSRSKRKTIDLIRESLDEKIEEVSGHIDSATATLHDNFLINSQTIVTSANQVVTSIEELIKSLR